DSQARPDAESACDQAREANMNSSDALSRFLEAQDPVYEIALAELRAGRKRSHWMWFIFPQLRSLGRSSTAQFYGIADRAEAQAYLAHPRLGARLVECTHAVLVHKHSSADAIFGYPDVLKFRSSLTLFGAVASKGCVFEEALQLFFPGEPDAATLHLIDTDSD